MEFALRREASGRRPDCKKEEAKGGPGDKVPRPGVCTLVGSIGRASVAQGFTLGWGMFGPRGADASGYALGGFDIA